MERVFHVAPQAQRASTSKYLGWDAFLHVELLPPFRNFSLYRRRPIRGSPGSPKSAGQKPEGPTDDRQKPEIRMLSRRKRSPEPRVHACHAEAGRQADWRRREPRVKRNHRIPIPPVPSHRLQQAGGEKGVAARHREVPLHVANRLIPGITVETSGRSSVNSRAGSGRVIPAGSSARTRLTRLSVSRSLSRVK